MAVPDFPYEWWAATEQGDVQRRDVSIALLDEVGNDVKRWKLSRAWPVRYVVSDLNAQGNDVVIESLELAYERMVLDE